MKQENSGIIKKYVGGTITIRLIIVGILASINAALLYINGIKLHLFQQETGIALEIFLIIITFSLLMCCLSKSLNRAVKKRKDVEAQLNSAKNEFSANEIIYRNLIENSGVVMYTTDIRGNISFASSKSYQLTGYSVKELSGMHYTNLIDNDWLEEIKGKYKRQLKNKIEETLIEFCIRTKNGEVKWVEQSVILVTDNETPVGFQCIIKEITERKEMETVLRKYELELVQNQERLQSILDNATSFMFIKNLEGKYLVINKQFKETFNVTDEDVIGKTLFDFMEPVRAQRLTDKTDEVLLTGKPVEFEETIIMEDGVHHFLIIKFPLINAQNNIYGSSGIGTDITERVRYQEQLIQAKKIAEDAKKLQEQFLANMSHEIRTPMNGIQGMTDLLLETRLTNEQKDFTGTIKRSSDNLLVIINDILDFSKIQAGKLTIEKIDFKLIEIIENLKAIFRFRVQEKGLQLSFDIDTNVPAILNGDPFRLNQILVNLIGNSIKFTHQGSITVRIQVKEKPGELIPLSFSISDTGIGIPEDKINSIFESFTQASVETTRKYGGTGLGLAITKQLLEMQGGSISVKSEMNTGTVFNVTIPYFQSQSGKTANFTGNDVKNYRTLLTGKKFLIAEDNEVNQKVIRHVLQKAGGTVDIANNGLEAIGFLHNNNNYDLIIMDLQMPEMDGYTATKHIREEMQLSIPIIAMTASALKGEKAKCLAIGMNEYLSKPFDATFLYKRINEILNEIPPVTKNVIMDTEKQPTEKLFDLSMLLEMDDNDYVSEIVTSFLETTSLELVHLKKACSSSSFEEIYKSAHKLKGSTSLVQAEGLIKILVKLEEFSKAGITEGLPVLAEQATNEFKKVEAPLKEYLKNIKQQHV